MTEQTAAGLRPLTSIPRRGRFLNRSAFIRDAENARSRGHVVRVQEAARPAPLFRGREREGGGGCSLPLRHPLQGGELLLRSHHLLLRRALAGRPRGAMPGALTLP